MLALTRRNRYGLAFLSGSATFLSGSATLGERMLTECDWRRFSLPQGGDELQEANELGQAQPPEYAEQGATILCEFDFNIFWLG